MIDRSLSRKQQRFAPRFASRARLGKVNLGLGLGVGLALMLGGCVSEESVGEPMVGAAHYTSPADGPFHSQFQPVSGGYAAVSDRYRARVTEDAILYLYEPARAGNVGNRSALAFETRTIRRGGVSVGLSSPSKTGLHEGLTFSRGPVSELFRSAARGVEQTWQFASEPDGDGDLVIRVAVGGAEQVETGADGVHFQATDGSWGVLYEHPSWIDARGSTTRIPAVYEGGGITLRVPAAVLDTSTFPARLDGS